MLNPKQLSEEQISSIKNWAASGLDLNALQKKINDELGLKATFMDTRFLLLDLNIDLVSQTQEETDAKPSEETPVKDPLIPTGTTSVTIDEITPAHALIAGKVTFASGKRASWYLDKMGRIDWSPINGEPDDEDLKGFEQELQKILRSQMGGI